MITYTYRCEKCGYTFVTKQSIKDKKLEKCDECGEVTLERVIQGGFHVSVRPEITTIGQLAEANTKKIGKNKIKEEEAKKKESEPSRPTPWYGLPDYERLNKMTPEQKIRFVMEGR